MKPSTSMGHRTNSSLCVGFMAPQLFTWHHLDTRHLVGPNTGHHEEEEEEPEDEE